MARCHSPTEERNLQRKETCRTSRLWTEREVRVDLEEQVQRLQHEVRRMEKNLLLYNRQVKMVLDMAKLTKDPVVVNTSLASEMLLMSVNVG